MKMHTVGDISSAETWKKYRNVDHSVSVLSTPSRGSDADRLADRGLPLEESISVQQANSPKLAPWLARTCGSTEAPARDFDWGGVVDKVAVVLERFGQHLTVSEPGGVAGVKMVRGMAAASLVPLIGLEDDSHNIRRLLRTIEHRGKEHRHHPAHKSVGSRGPEASVAVSVGDVMHAGDAVIYLRKEHTDSPSRPSTQTPKLVSKVLLSEPNAWDKSVGKWPHPKDPLGFRTLRLVEEEHPITAPPRELPRGAAARQWQVDTGDGRVQSIELAPSDGMVFKANSMAKKMPTWRDALKDNPQLRQNKLQHWRGQLLP